MEKQIASLEELSAEAARFVKTLQPRKEGATLVTLSGELGTGKTAFTQAVAKALGVAETVTSPTFVLEKIYALEGSKADFTRIAHIDAYRLSGGHDLRALGFDELMSDPQNLILLEWPERVADALGRPAVSIQLETGPDGSRNIRYGT